MDLRSPLEAMGVSFAVVSTPRQTRYFEAIVWQLTPGSERDAWINDDIQMKNRYAKKKGIAGETRCER